jgi:hypothetical protein
MKPNKYASPYGQPPTTPLSKMVDVDRHDRLMTMAWLRRLARRQDPSIAERIQARWDARKEARALQAAIPTPQANPRSSPTRL